MQVTGGCDRSRTTGSASVDVVGFDRRLDLMIFRVFSNLNNPVIP